MKRISWHQPLQLLKSASSMLTMTMTTCMLKHHSEMIQIETDHVACVCGQLYAAASNADMRINSCQLMQAMQESR